MAEPSDNRRAELIAAAQANWISALTDLGGRNTLLYYKDRRAGTLDLATADPANLERFLRTGSIRLTRLFSDADARADAIRRVQAIHRKSRELLEERGLRAAYLATGMATWDELFLEPAAPVLLRGLTITPTRARHDDFHLALDDEVEVNPVLLHKLATVYGADAERATGDHDQLRAIAAAAEVPGFDIQDRRVIGTFTYSKLPMVRDMQAAGELLADSDVVAAIAGDAEAQELLSGDRGEVLELDSPEDDYSVLDADSSQRSTIDAVLSGRSLVIHGPPGTGKSQTIANLIAALVAKGRKVLFVAEKRAAIDAVLSRLKGADLGDLVLDIHEGTRDRLRIARDLGDTLDLAQTVTEGPEQELDRRLIDRQRRLSRHVAGLHEPRPPWGVSAFQIQSALLGVPAEARTPVRLFPPEHIDREAADRIRDELRDFAHLGGFTLRPGSTPWYGASLRTAEQARQAADLASRLHSHLLPLLAYRVDQACAEAGLRAPEGHRERVTVLQLFAGVAQTMRRLSPRVFESDPSRLAAAAGDGTAGDGPLGLRERHALRKRARALWLGAGKPERAELHAALAEAAEQLAEWDARRLPPPAPDAWRAGPDGTSPSGRPPWPPSDLGGLLRLQAECEAQLASLRAYVRVPDDPGEVLAALCADRDTAWKLPRLYDLGMRFDALGLGQLLDDLARKQATADLAAAAFDHAWYSSILDHVRVSDPRYAAERGDALDEIAGDFRERDIRHLAANRARVRRAWAVRLRDAEDRHPLQARVIRKQAALRRGQLPLRRLLDQTGDVLFALKPCWAMSPLIVSQVLPATRLFDVVIFDEASQIVPADAVPSVMRAHQIVVAGDDRQLPPTNFFRQVGDGADDAEDEESMVSFGAGFESVLDALRPLLPTWPLTWHYRSRDERLVAFSNARIYGGALTTFPGVSRGDCLRHVVVAQPAAPTTGPGQEASVPAEVDKVVELVLDHARARPGESLGVIALGMRHAERVDQALREALAEHPELEDFFAEDAPEPFFVKNLERVQGDERDAIILTIGYGKHRDGRMRYQWGPLLRDGGERRLNVAATRAKHRLTLVSSFSSHDVDPARVTKAGARLLADYLEYAGSGGTPADASGGTALNPFEADVRDRLARHGITVVPQYGVGGFRVDFAATHPRDPDRMVLAIEADGASYRDSRSVRDRDRLRKEHLERLGWNFHRLWSTNWFHNPQAEADKLRKAYQEAVAAYEPEPEPERAPEPPPPPHAAAEPDHRPPGPRRELERRTRAPAAELDGRSRAQGGELDGRSQAPGGELDRPG
ncbi:AAA domain-containing protein [Nonomuraea turcica]|uniref:AAA domain-containing protein n=1 Tax=Nonomuraea sp. G32 TaxID=3067274 RepID=UPI00273AA6E0|nr:AAA domain-containing protein [Nonomuraea sp. G32]MDP4507030.1 AAA domain-containing protein [Nonomuraea sp. G32]